MKIFIFLILFFLTPTIHAYQLSGNMINNNDGTYEVNLRSDNDIEFTGNAVTQSDGTLFVTVALEDKGSEIYIGIATPNHNGTYDLRLRNNSTGIITTGVMSE